MATAEQILTTAKSFGPAKRIFLRRHLRQDGWGDMVPALAKSIEKMAESRTVDHITRMLANEDAAYTDAAVEVAKGLVLEGYDAATVGSGTFIDVLKQLLTVLLPLLAGCIPA